MLFRNSKLEASLLREKLDLQDKLDAISRSQAMIEFNVDGIIISANDNFLSTMGYAAGEIVGRHHSTFVDPSEVDSESYREFWQMLRAGKFAARKFRRLGKGGREVWIQASYNPVLDASGKAYKVLKVAVDITEAEQESARREEARKHAEETQHSLVEALGTSLSQLSRGDLTARISGDRTGSHKTVQDDYNAAIESLRLTLGEVLASVGSIRSGSDEIAGASDDLSRRTEQQAASLEQTAAALDQITATVKRSAAGAQQAAKVASGTRSNAEESGLVVREAVTAMGAIQKSSNEISQIISVIDEIAFQTNLLALNAGVEAARAGDAGRGFAVVAQEVRALAQRSAEAAKEIKMLISSSTSQVARGVKLVDDTGAALETIAGNVARMDSLIAEIAGSAHEQSTALAQVNSAINQMDQVTQQNAAMVEETTAAAGNLQSEAMQLASMVQRFNTGTQPSLATNVVHVSEARKGPSAPGNRRHAPARQVATRSGASAALKAAEWEEF